MDDDLLDKQVLVKSALPPAYAKKQKYKPPTTDAFYKNTVMSYGFLPSIWHLNIPLLKKYAES